MNYIVARDLQSLEGSEENAEFAFIGVETFQKTENGWENMVDSEDIFEDVEETVKDELTGEEAVIVTNKRTSRGKLRFLPPRPVIDAGFVDREKAGAPKMLNFHNTWSEEIFDNVKVFDHDLNGDTAVLVGY